MGLVYFTYMKTIKIIQRWVNITCPMDMGNDFSLGFSFERRGSLNLFGNLCPEFQVNDYDDVARTMTFLSSLCSIFFL